MIDPNTATFRQSYKALLWGGILSGIGSIAAILIAGRLFSVFTPQSIMLSSPGSLFILNALFGATVWVLIGTLLRVPVSTTHGIVGAIIIQAWYFYGSSSLEWNFLIWRILLPLMAGPIAAIFGAYVLAKLERKRAENQSSHGNRSTSLSRRILWRPILNQSDGIGSTCWCWEEETAHSAPCSAFYGNGMACHFANGRRLRNPGRTRHTVPGHPIIQ